MEKRSRNGELVAALSCRCGSAVQLGLRLSLLLISQPLLLWLVISLNYFSLLLGVKGILISANQFNHNLFIFIATIVSWGELLRQVLCHSELLQHCTSLTLSNFQLCYKRTGCILIKLSKIIKQIGKISSFKTANTLPLKKGSSFCSWISYCTVAAA